MTVMRTIRLLQLDRRQQAMSAPLSIGMPNPQQGVCRLAFRNEAANNLNILTAHNFLAMASTWLSIERCAIERRPGSHGHVCYTAPSPAGE